MAWSGTCLNLRAWSLDRWFIGERETR